MSYLCGRSLCVGHCKEVARHGVWCLAARRRVWNPEGFCGWTWLGMHAVFLGLGIIGSCGGGAAEWRRKALASVWIVPGIHWGPARARHRRAQLWMTAGLPCMWCVTQEAQVAGPRSTARLRDTWWRPLMSGADVPQGHWLQGVRGLSCKGWCHTSLPGCGTGVTRTGVLGQWWWSVGNQSGLSNQKWVFVIRFLLWCRE